MQSTARLAGHPIHPMLIPYPFALLSAATVFDILARQRGDAYGRTAAHLQNAGLLSAVAAAIPGLVDYFGSVPRGTPAATHATWHALANSSALAAFLMARRERHEDGSTSDRGLGYALLGTALLGVGGWLGGSLVYHHHIGVDDESPSAERSLTRRRAGVVEWDADLRGAARRSSRP